MTLFVFGYGYVARALARRLGWPVTATARSAEAAALRAEGVTPVDPTDRRAMAEAVKDAGAILVAAPPGDHGCPGLSALVPALAVSGAFPDWIGYLSGADVYGEREGRWVFETSPLAARSVEGARRVRAERDWLEVGRGMGLTTQVFRLARIYGPGCPIPSGPGGVVSAIHVDDAAAGLAASIARPRAGGVYNLSDDAPAPTAGTGPNSRLSNARAKAELDWRPAYPSRRDGLAALAEADGLLHGGDQAR